MHEDSRNSSLAVCCLMTLNRVSLLTMFHPISIVIGASWNGWKNYFILFILFYFYLLRLDESDLFSDKYFLTRHRFYNVAGVSISTSQQPELVFLVFKNSNRMVKMPTNYAECVSIRRWFHSALLLVQRVNLDNKASHISTCCLAQPLAKNPLHHPAITDVAMTSMLHV